MTDRLNRHHSGKVDYTSDKLPVTLLGFTAFRERQKAFAYERYLKSGSGRAFKLKRLI
ncbi:MAG: GIY-YIG nuclease family protein [Chitinophagaceae bacterium]|nr:GIY-YIG nuclease family protein [Chitinophagaceae bacterium]